MARTRQHGAGGLVGGGVVGGFGRVFLGGGPGKVEVKHVGLYLENILSRCMEIYQGTCWMR